MFKIRLSPESQSRIEAQEVESLRLYGLADRWLGEALLNFTRTARRDAPDLAPEGCTYNDTFVWHVLPELAYRLGARSFETEERSDWEIRHFSDEQLRDRTMGCICNISTSAYWGKHAWMMLLREPANGNPACFALDRILPGNIERPDMLVKRLSEIAKCRGVDFNGVWTPNMLGGPEPTPESGMTHLHFGQ